MLEKIKEFLQTNWKQVFIAIAIITVLLFAYTEYKEWKQHIKDQALKDNRPIVSVNTDGNKSKSGETQVVYLQGQNTNTKEIVYVPKEVDSNGAPEKTDVEFKKEKGKVYVKVNGKEIEVPSDVQEDSKFEKGKLVVTEETEMRIKITAPKPAFNVGLGWSTNGVAAQANFPVYKDVSGWVYGDMKTAAGGIQFPIHK